MILRFIEGIFNLVENFRLKNNRFYIKIGKVKGRFWKREYLSQSELNHHVHIVGASGFGKTVLLTKILKNQIQNGQGAIWIDMKGDRDTVESMVSYVRDCGREEDLYIFSLNQPNISSNYNLLGSGNATEILDRIMTAFNWSEEYYKNQIKSYLLKLLTIQVHLRDRGLLNLDLNEVYKGLTDKDYLLSISNHISKSDIQNRMFIEELYRYLSKADTADNLKGLIVQLEGLMFTSFGEKLKSVRDGINLFQAVNEGKIVFIFLDSRRYKESAMSLGRMIIKDLISTSARIDDEIPRQERVPFVCFIDEFADIAQEDFIAFPDRARSSKMSLVLSHQDLADLEKVSPTFQNRIMANISIHYVFLQSNQESAEKLAQRAGTRTVWKETLRAERLLWFSIHTGDKSLRESEEYIIHPNVIKRLRVGECVVVKKYPWSHAHVIRVYHDGE